MTGKALSAETSGNYILLSDTADIALFDKTDTEGGIKLNSANGGVAMEGGCLVYSRDTAVEFKLQEGVLNYGGNPVRFFENNASTKFITLEAGNGTVHNGQFVGEEAKLYEVAKIV